MEKFPKSLERVVTLDSFLQITDLPPGRVPVKTYSIVGDDEGFEKVYEVYSYPCI